MVVQPNSPCRVRYIKRKLQSTEPANTKTENTTQTTAPIAKNCFKIDVDLELCQGHASCMAEAPEIFHVDDKGKLNVLQETPDNALLSKAQKAAKYCPTSAIKISQD